jgi:hypothetical protein
MGRVFREDVGMRPTGSTRIPHRSTAAMAEFRYVVARHLYCF